MAISPFSARPASPDGERRRTRLALLIAAVGIAAIVIAYLVSPGVRHAVSHAEHSVKHAVVHVFDPDRGRDDHARRHAARRPARPAPASTHRSSAPVSGGFAISQAKTAGR